MPKSRWETHTGRGRRPNTKLLVLILLNSFLWGTAWGFDRDKSDVVTLRRGDRIYGDIVSLQYGLLTVKTDNMGTLSIEWPAVRSKADATAPSRPGRGLPAARQG